MDPECADGLKKRHAFDTWCGANASPFDLLVLDYFLHSRAIPGWRMETCEKAVLPAFPPFIQSIWRRTDRSRSMELRIDVYECRSRPAAHEFLIRVLNEYQIPSATRREHLDVGDVAFTGPTDAGILFARANLVVHMASAGRDVVAVTESARLIDRDVYDVEQFALTLLAPSTPFEAQCGDACPLGLIALKQSAQLPCRRIFAWGGKIALENDVPNFRADAPGAHEIEAYTEYPGGEVTRQAWSVKVQ